MGGYWVDGAVREVYHMVYGGYLLYRSSYTFTTYIINCLPDAAQQTQDNGRRTSHGPSCPLRCAFGPPPQKNGRRRVASPASTGRAQAHNPRLRHDPLPRIGILHALRLLRLQHSLRNNRPLPLRPHSLQPQYRSPSVQGWQNQKDLLLCMHRHSGVLVDHPGLRFSGCVGTVPLLPGAEYGQTLQRWSFHRHLWDHADNNRKNLSREATQNHNKLIDQTRIDPSIAHR